jgi:hypothetical protein
MKIHISEQDVISTTCNQRKILSPLRDFTRAGVAALLNLRVLFPKEGSGKESDQHSTAKNQGSLKKLGMRTQTVCTSSPSERHAI